MLVVCNGTFVLKLNPRGDFLALAAAACWAVYSVLLRRVSQGLDPILVTRRTLFWGAVTAIPRRQYLYGTNDFVQIYDRFDGKLYTVTRNNETLSDVSLWTSDAAWTKTYDAPGYKITTIERIPAEGSDWLSVTSDGTKVTVSATANTTGAPRQAKLVFGNGSQKTTIDLTQIDESDFAGAWDMTAFKVFTTMGSTTTNNYDPKWGAVGSQPSDIIMLQICLRITGSSPSTGSSSIISFGLQHIVSQNATCFCIPLDSLRIFRLISMAGKNSCIR